MKWPGIIVLLFYFSCYQSIAQSGGPKVENYTTANGLTDNAITALFRDSRGFLWIATENGVNRFDGRSFKQYKTIGENGLTDYNIKCLTEDGDGNIWIGTEFGLNKLDPFTEKITRYYEGEGPGTIPYRWCNNLYVDKQKDLWLSSEKGIALYNKRTNSFTNYPISVYGADPKINKYITNMLEDHKDRFWLTSSFGIKLFDRKAKKYKSYHLPETVDKRNQNAVYTLCEDLDGNILAGNYEGTLLKYDTLNDHFERIQLSNILPGSMVISSIRQIKLQGNNQVLVATNIGLYTIERSNDGVYSLQKFISAENENFTCILQLDPGNLWVGSNGGLLKIKTGHPAFQWVPSSTNQEEQAYHIIPDINDPDDQFYFTQTNSWNKFDLSKKTATPFLLSSSAPVQLMGINRWVSDGKGYWITSLYGFGYFDDKKRFTDLTHLIRERSGQSNTGCIARDDSGKLWLTMRRSGIMVYDPVLKRSEVLFADTLKPDHVFGLGINDLQKGTDGFIYFTCNNKLYKIDPSDQSYKVISPSPEKEPLSISKLSPRELYFTTDKRVFASSNLRIYELKNDVLVPVYPSKGYSSFSISTMKGNANAEIWLNSSEGFFKTDTSFKKLMNMNRFAGGFERTTELFVNDNGFVFFPQAGGLGILDERQLGNNAQPLPPLISRIRYGKQEKYLLSPQSPSIKSSFKDAIEIEFSCPGFMNESPPKLFYELEGWDKEWKELTNGSMVRYEQLPPGHYTFKTKAISPGDNESSETVLKFRIIPPFYRTWWFIGLVILALSAALFFFYRFRLRKAIEMERMRTRIATDLHDDIGATLSSISMYSEAVKNQVKEKMPHLEPVLNKMGENSREMVTSMSDIVWAINPDNDSGEKLLKRMEGHARDVCAVKNIKLDFVADEKLNDLKLSLEQRKNIYLVFKEALNNALKYSFATMIGIRVDQHDKELALTVKDNGKGFNTELAAGGNGLKNMRLRAEEIDASISIGSKQNEGTTIELVCPV